MARVSKVTDAKSVEKIVVNAIGCEGEQWQDLQSSVL